MVFKQVKSGLMHTLAACFKEGSEPSGVEGRRMGSRRHTKGGDKTSDWTDGRIFGDQEESVAPVTEGQLLGVMGHEV